MKDLAKLFGCNDIVLVAMMMVFTVGLTMSMMSLAAAQAQLTPKTKDAPARVSSTTAIRNEQVVFLDVPRRG